MTPHNPSACASVVAAKVGVMRGLSMMLFTLTEPLLVQSLEPQLSHIGTGVTRQRWQASTGGWLRGVGGCEIGKAAYPQAGLLSYALPAIARSFL